MEIWSRNKDCRRLPDFLVIGPQKTGTTALYRFLQLHPAIESNFNSDKTFEELQFFSNSDFYAQGNLSKSIDNWSGVTTVAINELLCMKNVGARIAMDFS